MKKYISISSLDAAHLLTKQIIGWLNEELSRDFYLAISGGSTPMILFHVWREFYVKDIDWQRLQIYWVDERFVDPRDSESNYGMTRKILLDHVPISENNIHRILGEIDSSFEKERYSKEVLQSVPLLNGIPCFDLILLGMGDDGHTASIFPGQTEFYTSPEIYVVSPKPNTNSVRLSMSGSVLKNAKRVVFFVTGEGKSKILQEIFDNAPNAANYPANYFAKKCTNVEFYLDEGAARLLTFP
ncbi:MAG: 6-phosphogluconolactonase [Bacteroidales bacterium]|nr:6-phosphogluconolactonase [Bacteroidales bacterium]